MRRIVLAMLACAAVLAISTSAALADHHNGRHERRHRGEVHQRSHELHHRRRESRHQTRVRHERWGTDDGAESTAGSVASFANGVLTLRLADGSMVSGKVTSATEIECGAPERTAIQADDRDGGGDHGEDRGDTGDQGDDGNDEGLTCGTGALMPGTAVHEAELRVSSAGQRWEQIELIVQEAGAIHS